jgi:hypothetical protein
VHIIETGRAGTADTIEWFPVHTPLPLTSAADDATAAARDLVDALRNPAPKTPFAGIDPEKLNALNKLATIFRETTESNACQYQNHRFLG